MKKIVIFASGSGSNAQNIALHFQNNGLMSVVAILTNNPNAKVIDKAIKLGLPNYIFSKNDLNDGIILQKMQQLEVDFIVLAGFLLKFPQSIISQFPNRILNIHPSLLPQYGGKGMFGMNVHQAVLENNEKKTGITIHYVNENYDDGAIVFQESTSISSCSSAIEIAEKVQELEQKFFPMVIEQEISKLA